MIGEEVPLPLLSDLCNRTTITFINSSELEYVVILISMFVDS